MRDARGAFQRHRVALFVVGDAVRFGVHPLVDALRLRVALLPEARGRARDHRLAVALGRDGEFELRPGDVHRPLVDDDVPGVDRRLLDFVTVEAVRMNLDLLIAVGAERPNRETECGAGRGDEKLPHGDHRSRVEEWKFWGCSTVCTRLRSSTVRAMLSYTMPSSASVTSLPRRMKTGAVVSNR